MNNKNYLIEEDTHQKLMIYKYKNNFRNINQTIKHLLQAVKNG